LIRLIEVMLKPIDLDLSESGLNKDKCLLSLAFIVLQFLYACACLYVLKDTYLYIDFLTGDFTGLHKLVLGLILAIPSISGLYVFLRITNQGLASIGLKKDGLLAGLLIGLVCCGVLIFIHGIDHILSVAFLYKLVFSLLCVACFEELLFRGFIWSRLEYLFGKSVGFLITGLLFGLWHVPFQVIWNNYSLFEIFVRGNSDTINVLGGLFGHLLFGYFYTRHKNVILPIVIHSMFLLL